MHDAGYFAAKHMLSAVQNVIMLHA